MALGCVLPWIPDLGAILQPKRNGRTRPAQGAGLFYILRQALFSHCEGISELHQDRVGIEDCVMIVLYYGCHGLPDLIYSSYCPFADWFVLGFH